MKRILGAVPSKDAQILTIWLKKIHVTMRNILKRIFLVHEFFFLQFLRYGRFCIQQWAGDLKVFCKRDSKTLTSDNRESVG